MIFEFTSLGLNTLFSILFALMETALFAFFLHPYVKEGCARLEGGKRAAAFLLFALGMVYCSYSRASINMVANIAAHYALVMAGILALFRLSPGKAAFDALIFHLSMDLSKTLILDLITPLAALKSSGEPGDTLLLMGATGLVLGAALGLLCRPLCHRRTEKLTPFQTVQVFFPAIPYLYFIYIKYKEYELDALSMTEEINMLNFAICLMGLVVAVLTERTIVSSQEKERAARAHLAVERQQEEMQLHLRRIEEINKLSHDMRNHLSTIAAMSGRDEVSAYIETLLPQFRPVAVTAFSGVDALDVLLSHKMDEAAQAGAALVPCVSTEAAQLLSRLSAPDLCTIFGNLLDNAIEAVENVARRDMRDIVLRVAKKSDFLLIRTENYFEGERSALPDVGFVTTKEDAIAHGYGHKNVADTVRRLGGEMSIQAENCRFIVNILLPIATEVPDKHE